MFSAILSQQQPASAHKEEANEDNLLVVGQKKDENVV